MCSSDLRRASAILKKIERHGQPGDAGSRADPAPRQMSLFPQQESQLDEFLHWKRYCGDFLKSLGMKAENIRMRDHEKEELSHYSNATTDIEYRFPFGWGELWGIADRTDFDLKKTANFRERR